MLLFKSFNFKIFVIHFVLKFKYFSHEQFMQINTTTYEFSFAAFDFSFNFICL